MLNDNIDYYNRRADDFIAHTKDADLSVLRSKFVRHIPAGGRILDLGCGSGRDSLAFKQMGFDVYAIDGSSELVNYCKLELGDSVECITFENFKTDAKFDGIWACASLIHVERHNLKDIVKKYTEMLNDKGVFFMSFKNRAVDYSKDARSFTCFNQDSLDRFLRELGIFSDLTIFETFDVRPDRESEKWVNAFAVKDDNANNCDSSTHKTSQSKRPPDTFTTNCITGDKTHLLKGLRESISKAKHINIIVAFLMESGVRLIAENLKNAASRGAVIKILCGNYLNITQPSALILLKDALGEKVDLRFYSNPGKSFHPKAYIFEYNNTTEIYVGSSNLSCSALTDGIEWNYRLDSLSNQKDCEVFKGVFEDLFLNHSYVIDDKEIREYSKNWKKPKFLQQMITMEKRSGSYPEPEPGETADENNTGKTGQTKRPHVTEPTDAQIEALYELKKSREKGWDKGLVVAATGIGKTFLAAFDSREYRKILFLAHREEILTQAMQTFQKVRPDLKSGVFNGSQKDRSFDVLFASVQTLGKTQYLNSEYFAVDAFEYIVVDEFHHAVANGYRKILEYFTPRFLLGLTATPERLDNKDVFALCDYNTVYEARLSEAIQKGWLVPFRYYGVYDDTNYDSVLYRNGSYDEAQLEQALSRENRAEAILEHYRKYNSRRALGFCSGRMHACYMAKYFRTKGIPSCAVISGSVADNSYLADGGSIRQGGISSGASDGVLYEDVVMDRTEALEKLKSGQIKIIFSVDMFNEGVDIPALDMVLFLRPTESPTVFLQQLGRGLRWDENKKYLNILDFIGNYKNACLIPAFLASSVSAYDSKLDISVSALCEILPDECFVDFDLQVINIFKRMQQEQMQLEEKIAGEYKRIKEYLGERPSRLSMYTYFDDKIYAVMHKKKQLNLFADYLSFLKKIGDILPDEEALINTKAHEFLKEIESTKMTKLYKMPLLLSFIKRDKLLPSVGEKEIAGSFRLFYSHKSNSVDLLKDNNTKGFATWADSDYFKLAVDNPIKAFSESAKEFFSYKNGRLWLSDDLVGFLSNPAFVRHYRDVVDYRTRKFYRERLADDIR